MLLNCRFLHEIWSPQEMYRVLSVPEHGRSIAWSSFYHADLLLYICLEILPKLYRTKAKVLTILRSTPNVSWNTRSEMLFDSRPISGRNID